MTPVITTSNASPDAARLGLVHTFLIATLHVNLMLIVIPLAHAVVQATAPTMWFVKATK